MAAAYHGQSGVA